MHRAKKKIRLPRVLPRIKAMTIGPIISWPRYFAYSLRLMASATALFVLGPW
jgi:hypothetical protein